MSSFNDYVEYKMSTDGDSGGGLGCGCLPWLLIAYGVLSFIAEVFY